MDYLKKNHTVIWFDYRGHHNSQIPKDPSTLTINAIAQDVECLVDELKLPPATFLGHSMGVNVVLDLFRRAPKKVRALVLANGSARDPMETLFGTNLMQYALPLARRRTNSPRGWQMRYGGNRQIPSSPMLSSPGADSILGLPKKRTSPPTSACFPPWT